MNPNIFKKLAERERLTIKSVVEKMDITEAGFYRAIKTGSLRVKDVEKFAEVLNVSVCEVFECQKAAAPNHLNESETAAYSYKERYFETLEKYNKMLEENMELRRKLKYN